MRKAFRHGWVRDGDWWRPAVRKRRMCRRRCVRTLRLRLGLEGA